MSRSLRVGKQHIEKVKLALKRNSFPSQRALAIDLGLALSTVSRFLTGKPVDYATFVDICEQLGLDWQAIADLGHTTPPTITEKPSPHTTKQDWEELIDVSLFCGRTKELSTLQQWIVDQNCRLVAVLGMGGMGKTTLVTKLAQQIQESFECLIWRSLAHLPSPLATLSAINQFLCPQLDVTLPNTVESQISHLLQHLRTHRCLLIFDDYETVLQGGDIAGYHRPSYAAYSDLIERIGAENHQSCLILISREQPIEITALAGKTAPVRTLQIKGLKPADAQEMLSHQGFPPLAPGLEELIQIYRGNPAALKLTTATIEELFGGNINQFLGQTSLVIGDIFANLLASHFERLSDIETTIIYWLAIEIQPITFSQLKNNLWTSISSSQLLAALESLTRRSLIEQEQPSGSEMLFCLQPVVRKYVLNRFISEVLQDLLAAIEEQSTAQLGLLRSHTLVKKDAPQEIQQIQLRLILTRIHEGLRQRSAHIDTLEAQLQNLLSQLQNSSFPATGYAQENLLMLQTEIARI